jgi:hypothetical protein
MKTSEFNWLRMKPHKSGFVVADKTAYGVHGIRVMSWHRNKYNADIELRNSRLHGNNSTTVYSVEPD